MEVGRWPLPANPDEYLETDRAEFAALVERSRPALGANVIERLNRNYLHATVIRPVAVWCPAQYPTMHFAEEMEALEGLRLMRRIASQRRGGPAHAVIPLVGRRPRFEVIEASLATAVREEPKRHLRPDARRAAESALVGQATRFRSQASQVSATSGTELRDSIFRIAQQGWWADEENIGSRVWALLAEAVAWPDFRQSAYLAWWVDCYAASRIPPSLNAANAAKQTLQVALLSGSRRTQNALLPVAARLTQALFDRGEVQLALDFLASVPRLSGFIRRPLVNSALKALSDSTDDVSSRPTGVLALLKRRYPPLESRSTRTVSSADLRLASDFLALFPDPVESAVRVTGSHAPDQSLVALLVDHVRSHVNDVDPTVRNLLEPLFSHDVSAFEARLETTNDQALGQVHPQVWRLAAMLGSGAAQAAVVEVGTPEFSQLIGTLVDQSSQVEPDPLLGRVLSIRPDVQALARQRVEEELVDRAQRKARLTHLEESVLSLVGAGEVDRKRVASLLDELAKMDWGRARRVCAQLEAPPTLDYASSLQFRHKRLRQWTGRLRQEVQRRQSDAAKARRDLADDRWRENLRYILDDGSTDWAGLSGFIERYAEEFPDRVTVHLNELWRRGKCRGDLDVHEFRHPSIARWKPPLTKPHSVPTQRPKRLAARTKQVGRGVNPTLDILTGAPRDVFGETLEVKKRDWESAPDPDRPRTSICRARIHQALVGLLDDDGAVPSLEFMALHSALADTVCAAHAVAQPVERGDVEAVAYGLLMEVREEVLTPSSATQDQWQEAKTAFRGIDATRLPADSHDLYAWQSEALEAWCQHGRQGVVEAVTGSGKTRIGIVAALDAAKRGRAVVILVPRLVLQDQWVKELAGPAECAGIRVQRLGTGNPSGRPASGQVLVAVVNSWSNLMRRMIGKDREVNPSRIMLIADECHNYKYEPAWLEGGVDPEGHKSALHPQFPERLGLTATLEGAPVADYFGGVVFTLNHARALKDQVVSPYRLLMIGSRLQPRERALYDQATWEIRQHERELCSRSTHLEQLRRRYTKFTDAVMTIAELEDQELNGVARRWLKAHEERREIVAKSKGKAQGLIAALPVIASSRGCLVFTLRRDPAKSARDTVLAHGIKAGYLDGEADSEFRAEVLQDLAEGRIRAVVAPLVLDEGVNVPSADTAVVVANSKGRRQAIQRLGRIIRKKPPDAPLPILVWLYIEDSFEDPEVEGEGYFLQEIWDNANKKFGPSLLIGPRTSDSEKRRLVRQFIAADSNRA